MRYTLNLLGLFFGLLVSAQVLASSITIVSDEWEGYTNKQGGGYYFELMKAIFEAQGVNVNVKLVPYKRSVDMVTTQKADVMLGAYKGETIEGTFSPHPLEIDKVDVAISPQMNDQWQGVESLEGKRVGALKGYAFDDYIDVKMRYKELSNLKSLLKMLNHGRLDAVIDYEADIKVSEQDIKESPNYIIKKAIIVNPSFAVFSNTNNGKAMLAIFNEGIQSLHKSGRLKEIMMSNLGVLSTYPIE